MATTREKLDALLEAADDRGLTPVAWWIGRAHHDQALAELEGAPDVTVDAGRLVEIGDLDVKLLTESPQRFALWCQEGALDL